MQKVLMKPYHILLAILAKSQSGEKQTESGLKRQARLVKNLLYSALVVFVFLTAIHCNAKNNNPDNTNDETYDSLWKTQQTTENLNISCQDLENCPEYIGGSVSFKEIIKLDASSGFEKKYYFMQTCSQDLNSSRQSLDQQTLSA